MSFTKKLHGVNRQTREFVGFDGVLHQSFLLFCEQSLNATLNEQVLLILVGTNLSPG